VATKPRAPPTRDSDCSRDGKQPMRQPVIVPDCVRVCWMKPIERQRFGWIQPTVRKPTKTSRKKYGVVSRAHRKKLHLKPMPPKYPTVQRRKIGHSIPRRACLCRSEIVNEAICQDHGHYPGQHEHLLGQYRLQQRRFLGGLNASA